MSTESQSSDTIDESTDEHEHEQGREKSQREHLQDAIDAVPQYKDNWERRVIFAWFTRVGDDAPHVVNADETAQTSWCSDCSSGVDPVEAEFFWVGWGSLCSKCTLQRFGKRGRNPRRDERDARLAEIRNEHVGSGGQSYEIRKPGDR